jgi:uncharacterized protein (TIGR03437 family)
MLLPAAVNAPAVFAGIPNAQSDLAVQIPVTATVNGISAEVASATLTQGAIGIYELRIVLPYNLPVSGLATLVIAQDGRLSNAVTIPVKSGIQ